MSYCDQLMYVQVALNEVTTESALASQVGISAIIRVIC